MGLSYMSPYLQLVPLRWPALVDALRQDRGAECAQRPLEAAQCAVEHVHGRIVIRHQRRQRPGTGRSARLRLPLQVLLRVVKGRLESSSSSSAAVGTDGVQGAVAGVGGLRAMRASFSGH